MTNLAEAEQKPEDHSVIIAGVKQETGWSYKPKQI